MTESITAAVEEFTSSDDRAPGRAGASTASRVLSGLAIFALIGIGFAVWLRWVPAGRPDSRNWFNVFYVLFARNEPLGLAVVALFCAIFAFVLHRAISPNSGDTISEILSANRARQVCLGIAAVVFAIAALGPDLVFHNYLLTADENLADFQAQIFLRGKLEAEVPAQFRDAVGVIMPTHAAYLPASHAWHSPYLPVYAALRAVFQAIGWQSLLNPFLAALTIFALFATARNVWPDKLNNAVLAVVLLATSSQFLIMSMTAYAMPAHLALNTIWLWLYSSRDRRCFYAAPLVGALAIGLHEPVVHALFALPFLVRFVFQRRWSAVFIYAAIYLAACAGWLLWQVHFQAPSAKGAASIFRLLNPRMLCIQPMNLLLLIGWAGLATPLLFVLGMRQFHQLPAFLRDAAASCVLTFGFYYFFYLDQAHGWGYRYMHGVLSCAVLVAVAGFSSFGHNIGARRAVAFVSWAAAASLLVLLPIRCLEAERFVRPFANAAAVLHAIPAKAVAFDPRDAWYSGDLIRNDPFLENRPLVVSLFGLTAKAVPAMEKLGDARFITQPELARLGLATERPNDYRRDPFQLGRAP